MFKLFAMFAEKFHLSIVRGEESKECVWEGVSQRLSEEIDGAVQVLWQYIACTFKWIK